MARWRLINGHYLNTVEKTEWEHKETDRMTGKANRKMFIVPAFMDPNDPADHNYPGEIIVAREGTNHERKDILFQGDPTPDMEPLDDEAEAISAILRNRWEHPIDSLPANGGMNAQESVFMEQMMQAFARATGQTATSPDNVSIPRAEFDALKTLVEDLKAQQATTKPSSAISRRA